VSAGTKPDLNDPAAIYQGGAFVLANPTKGQAA